MSTDSKNPRALARGAVNALQLSHKLPVLYLDNFQVHTHPGESQGGRQYGDSKSKCDVGHGKARAVSAMVIFHHSKGSINIAAAIGLMRLLQKGAATRSAGGEVPALVRALARACAR